MINMNEKFNGKKVLITGGLGFIGSNLAKELVNLGADVTIIDSLIPDMGGNMFNVSTIKDKVEIITKDLRDTDVINELVKDKDYIFNLAGHLSHVVSMNNPMLDLELNCISQLSLLEACKKHNTNVSIVFTGTRGQYGKAMYLPVNEKHELNSTDINGINKTAAESYHLLYCKAHGIHACSLRLTNTYGPGHIMKHNRQGFMGWFIRQAVVGETITIYGDGKQIRDWLYVDDHARALLHVALTGEISETYNIGGHNELQNIEVVKTVCGILDELVPSKLDGIKQYEQLITYVGDRAGHDVRYAIDATKIANELNWTPDETFATGIKKTVQWYLEDTVWCDRVKDGSYQGERLGVVKS